MRTTIDLDTDLLERIRREATRRRIPFKHYINLLLRSALEGRRSKPAAYRLPTHAMGAPQAGANLDKALQIADALDDRRAEA